MLLRCALAALALLVIAVAPAAAAPRDLGSLPGYLLTDDERFLAGVERNGTITVADLETDERSRHRVPERCQAVGAGAGMLIFSCAPSDPATVDASGQTLDLRTGETRPLPDIRRDTLGNLETASYADIGRRWVELTIHGYHYRHPEYMERATGRRVGDPTRNQPAIVADLDGDRLLHRLCSPLQRPRVPGDHLGLNLGPLQWHGRAAAAVTYTEREDGSQPHGRLVLQGCGRPARTLARCGILDCSRVVLDGRILAWTQGDRVRVRSLRTGRTRSLGRPSRYWQIALVDGRLYGTRGGRLVRLRG